MAIPILALVARARHAVGDDVARSRVFEQHCVDALYRWRDRLFPPQVIFRLFLLQILHANVAVNALRQLSGLAFSAGSYCDARARVPLKALQSFLAAMTRGVERLGASDPASGRVFVADGSSFSMPDTKPLRKHFGLSPRQKVGVGYPIASMIGLLDLATGLFIRMIASPLFTNDLRGVINLHPCMNKGDILLGDRAFCSYCHVAILNAAGMFCCLRLHQKRKTDQLGTVRWFKPASCPAWMKAAQFRLMPAFLDVRVVRHRIEQAGFRTQVCFIATTLTPEMGWTDRRIAELYQRRWEIETCLGYLKTTMKMNVLRCKSVDGVTKELTMYLIAYNLVRLAMLAHAHAAGVDMRRVSFIDALRLLAARALGLQGVEALIHNPSRHGRTQLRVIRRRLKPYDLLVRPRSQQIIRGKTKKKA